MMRGVMRKALLLAFFMSCIASVSPGAQPPVVLHDGLDQYSLGGHLACLEDPTGTLTIDDVASPEYEGRFKPVLQDVPNFGRTDSVYWARFQVVNHADPGTPWRIESGLHYFNDIRLYVPTEDGSGFVEKRSGSQVLISRRDIPGTSYAFRLPLPSETFRVFYMRFENQTMMILPLTIYSQNTFIARQQRMILLQGAFHGILLIMAAYNLVLFLMLRERSYAYLVFFIASMLLLQLLIDGYPQMLFPSINVWLTNNALALFYGLVQVSRLLFVSDYLSTRRNTPRLHRCLLALMGACAVASFISIFLPARFLVGPMFLLQQAATFLIFAICCILCRKRYRPAYYFLAAWLLLLASTTHLIFVRAGLLSYKASIENGYQVGLILVVLLLSLGLADRITLLKREREAARERALSLARENERFMIEQNILLEQRISERTEELVLAKEAAETSNRAKGDFVANMSHEIRTPINAIIGFVHLALRKDPSPALRKYLARIGTAAGSLMNIINDILDFSRIESGKLQFESVDFDLHGVMEEVAELSEPKAREKGLHLSFAVGDQLPRTLRGDPLRLKQVLLNLVGNGLKFTESGSIDVSVAAEEAPEPREDRICLRFSVKDTGIGMRGEQIEELFEPFIQADVSTTRKHGGSGLGLTISRQLVELMGGEIWVESRPGEGSLFAFTAVFQPGASDGSSLPTARRRASSAVPAPASPGGFRNALVLLVDDNEINRMVAGELLEEAGISVHTAATGNEAVEAVKREAYDMVLMDIQMSEMDGYETTRQIRRLGSTLPVVALTAKAMAGERERCLEAGMVDYLSKPFEPEELYSVVSRWIPARTADSVPVPVLSRSSAASGASRGLPSGDSIDTRLGLERANGNAGLYRKVLSAFARKHSGSCIEIQEQLLRGVMEEAVRTAHALKGAAGNIGATPLFKTAGKLETALTAGDLEHARALAAELQREHDRVLAAVDALVKRSAEGGKTENAEELPPAGPAEAARLIDQLSRALETQSTTAQTHLQTLKEALGNDGPWMELLSQLERHVADFDFDDALNVLRRMMNAE